MLQQLQDTYKGKKIFITGHTGFKGSWLLRTLSLLGAEIKGYALAPYTKDDIYYAINGNDLCTSVIADIRDKDRLAEEITNFAPDFIFHLAAQPLVRLSYDLPVQTFEVNAMGTANLLDVVHQLQQKCTVVLITTDKVYLNREWIYPYRENDRLGGYDPYSASKACAELIIDSYRNSFFNPNNYSAHHKAIAVARAGNVIGGGDWSKDRLLPDIAQALIKKETIAVRNPKSVRPWQHVMEPVAGYLLLGERLEKFPEQFAQAYNFGPYSGDTLTVEEIVGLAIRKWGSGSYKVLQQDEQLHEAGFLKLDITKAEIEIGWKPILNAKEAVGMTINWYKTFFENPASINELTENQVMHFLGDKSNE